MSSEGPNKSDALTQAWVTEAVRYVEHTGALEDSEAMRRAVARGTEGASHAAQICTRAHALGCRLGLQDALHRLQSAAPWALLILIALMLTAGSMLAGAVVDTEDRRINVVGALVALLGAHTLTFLLWLTCFLLPIGRAGHAARLWAVLAARLTARRGAHTQALLHSGAQLLQRARLLPWVSGAVSHGLWALTLSAAIVALLFSLSFKRYSLGWESTLIHPDSLARAVQTLGALPAWFGFTVPDAVVIHGTDPSLNAVRDRQLGWWLVGCLVVYGLLPRLLALALCLGVCQARRTRLGPDWTLPYYRHLIARLEALAPAHVVDPDTHAHVLPAPGHFGSGHWQAGWAVIGFELPPEQKWPPEPLPEPLLAVSRIAGSAGERQQLLTTLAELRPHTLVVVVSALSSPDRGTERFLRELLPLGAELRLLLGLPGSTAGDGDHSVPLSDQAGVNRWQRWLEHHGLQEIRTATQWTAIMAPSDPNEKRPAPVSSPLSGNQPHA